MFNLNAFPNLTEDFLIANRFFSIISKVWNCNFISINSDLPYASIKVPKWSSNLLVEHAINVWFGPSQNFSIKNSKNYGFITEFRNSYSSLLSNMNDFMLPENLILPLSKINNEDVEDYILIYLLPHTIDINLFIQTLRCWQNSNRKEKLRILAPYFSEKNLIPLIKENSNKEIYLSCPNSTRIEKIDDVFIKAKALIDVKCIKNISYASIISKCCGKPFLDSSKLTPVKIKEYYDGRRYSGLNKYFYSDDNLIEYMNNFVDSEYIIHNNEADIFALCKRMIAGDKLK
jgi:hypothetical protein